MMKSQLNFGILGCGMISHVHAKAICSLSNARLAGAADISRENAENFSKSYGIRAYDSFHAMLEDPEIDAVCICTPSGFHEPNAIDALDAGKHVVLEKPMALSTEGADRIVEACRRNNRLLTVISQLRFSPDIQRVKTMLRQNRFGRLVLCDLSMKYWRDESYYASSSWKGTFRYDGGGALMNQGIHGVDLLRYLAGDFTVVSGLCSTIHHRIEAEDTAAALIRFQSGAMGVIQTSTAAYPGFDRRIELTGECGSVVLRENRIEQLTLRDGTSERYDVGEMQMSRDPAAVSHDMHALQLANLIDAVNGEARLLSDAEEGR
ncbi:MAG: Gfo/Idh/MocA family oxidoreductase, partial [Ruminococcaceae bacterium]|nr:Gfo/Idh/MocA family oxidoreductase [Oscillospiraceae bacterium]